MNHELDEANHVKDARGISLDNAAILFSKNDSKSRQFRENRSAVNIELCQNG